MYIINSLADIQELKGKLPEEQEVLLYIEKLWDELRKALEPDVSNEEFGLAEYGAIILLDNEAEILEPLGLDYALEEAWPDFVEVLELAEKTYYKVGILENDYLPQVYMSKNNASDSIAEWLEGIAEEIKME